jgi:lipid-A-disaccharide synthase
LVKGCTVKVFLSVGEPSGDLHGANLIKALRQQCPRIECVGFGGPRMAAAGCELLADLTEYAVMWFLRALLHLPKFWWLYRQAKRSLRQQRPDAVVLIDYPGFNWWIARAAKKYGIPVFYYGVPQMWAWAPWRVRKMRRLVDHVLCKLPFEAEWFRQRGCEATYVGHPYFDQLAGHVLDPVFLQDYEGRPGPLIAILPGSRMQEVTQTLPWFLKMASLIQRRVPQARFVVASFNERQARVAGQLVAESVLPVEVLVGRTAELIHLSRCCLACSGSVSLELLYYTKPALILYRAGKLSLALAIRLFMKVRFITLVNLLAAKDPFLAPGECYDGAAARAEDVPLPEYLTWEDPSREMADRMVGWLKHETHYEQRVQRLLELKRLHVDSGASRTAAAYLLRVVNSPATIPGPPREKKHRFGRLSA